MNYISAPDRFIEAKRKALCGTPTKHCVSGALMRLYAWNGIRIDEEILLGLGEGVGFMYWHQKGLPPMLGGRAQPKPSMEAIAAARTGVALSETTTASAAKAEADLIGILEAGGAAVLQVDMGFLPYFDFSGGDYHFGGHAVLACGWDPVARTVLIADRENDFDEVPMADIAKARGSRFRPFPPANRRLIGDFGGYREPNPADLALSLRNQAAAMLHPPISNFGCRGLEKAAAKVGDWPKAMTEAELRDALFNLWIFASPVGGSGGGNFRHMLVRYVDYCAERCAGPEAGDGGPYRDAAALFRRSAAGWDVAAAAANAAREQAMPDMAEACAGIAAELTKIAAAETEAWGLCLAS